MMLSISNCLFAQNVQKSSAHLADLMSQSFPADSTHRVLCKNLVDEHLKAKHNELSESKLVDVHLHSCSEHIELCWRMFQELLIHFNSEPKKSNDACFDEFEDEYSMEYYMTMRMRSLEDKELILTKQKYSSLRFVVQSLRDITEKALVLSKADGGNLASVRISYKEGAFVQEQLTTLFQVNGQIPSVLRREFCAFIQECQERYFDQLRPVENDSHGNYEQRVFLLSIALVQVLFGPLEQEHLSLYYFMCDVEDAEQAGRRNLFMPSVELMQHQLKRLHAQLASAAAE